MRAHSPLLLSGAPRLPSRSSASGSREKAGTSVAGNNADAGAASDDDAQPSGGKGKSGLSAFAALGMEDPSAADGGEGEDEDFGGLMVRFFVARAF